MTATLGIDPGVRGGLAVLRVDGSVRATLPFRPGMTHEQLVCVVATGVEQLRGEGSRSVYVEKVGYIRGDGGQGAFTFGRVDGLIRGALIALGFPPESVAPMQWQAALGCLSGGNKNVTKRRAQEQWPSVKWTHAIADAALIAEYGRRRQLNNHER